ncbi:ATP-binding protein [Kitasatospora viridis]|uniref:Histidine kinase-like protein n=1 Tax=Kitasatospora viridis TaxID=281105 RepID=A0A561SG91_9ACTN|nr:ATP-binding protein [Kitasatospora viridis]TWF73879.1 histidine kinase-like protein [Kitasatospora viridis]
MTTHSAWLPQHRKSAGTARTMLRDFLADPVPNGELFACDAEVILSELVTNALLHGRSGPEQLIFIRFDLSPALLRIEVHDASGKPPTLAPVGADEECGRGLLLVERLSRDRGFGPREGIGKLVWATVGPEA